METDKMIKNLCWNTLCLRVLHGLSKKDMAARLGISVASLRKIEAGGPLPKVSYGVLYRITDTFGICATTLLESQLIPMNTLQ